MSILSANEVAYTVFSEQGFIVMTTHEPCPVGSVHLPDFYPSDIETRTALKCVGASSHAEFVAQVKRMNLLSGVFVAYNHVPGARYFRMEPMD